MKNTRLAIDHCPSELRAMLKKLAIDTGKTLSQYALDVLTKHVAGR